MRSVGHAAAAGRPKARSAVGLGWGAGGEGGGGGGACGGGSPFKGVPGCTVMASSWLSEMGGCSYSGIARNL